MFSKTIIYTDGLLTVDNKLNNKLINSSENQATADLKKPQPTSSDQTPSSTLQLKIGLFMSHKSPRSLTSQKREILARKNQVQGLTCNAILKKINSVQNEIQSLEKKIQNAPKQIEQYTQRIRIQYMRFTGQESPQNWMLYTWAQFSQIENVKKYYREIKELKRNLHHIWPQNLQSLQSTLEDLKKYQDFVTSNYGISNVKKLPLHPLDFRKNEADFEFYTNILKSIYFDEFEVNKEKAQSVVNVQKGSLLKK